MLRKSLFLIIISLFCIPGLIAQTGSATTSAATDAPKKRTPVFRPTKDQIKSVQEILKGKSLYSGEASGKYNTETRSGIKSFQKDNGLKETGTLNRATLEKFGVELTDSQKLIPVSPNSYADADADKRSEKMTKTAKTTSTASTTTAAKSSTKASDGPKRPAPFQANSDQIAALQKKLKDAKLFTGDADGKRTDELKGAIKKYQETNGLKATGGINAATLEKMGIALTDAQKANVAAQAAYDAAKNN
ncbi:MAG: peptidoglycan-binding domain-containing protein [Pyrinomonadaceae bacterium]